MRSVRHILLGILVAGLALAALAGARRISRVNKAAIAIPVYPGAREGGGSKRYFPRFFSWDDRSSARVRRVFALPENRTLSAIARDANTSLASAGWYLVMPDNLDQIENPQVIVWQREPDERLDLATVWPLQGMAREQRMYGGSFPAEFLDAPLVVEWSWALKGPRSAVPAPRNTDPRVLVTPPPSRP